jgi:glycyl-tRNA synthetase beta chain
MIDKGFEYDVIDAVINVGFDDILDSKLKIEELAKWKYKEEFSDILASFNRVSNLASKAKGTDINKELFTEKEEMELLNAFDSINSRFDQCLEKKEYGKALELLITLKKPIDDFFDSIMVMVEDEDIRNNRLGLLLSITNMMNRLADIGTISVK